MPDIFRCKELAQYEFCKKSIADWYKREKKILLVSILCGVVISVLAGLYTRQYSYQAVEAISSQVVRFHVLPNSNSEDDQALKVTVKERVLEQYREILLGASSIYEARTFLNANLAEIEQFAQNIVLNQGFNYPVRVSLASSRFPTKEYGSITLPAGMYESLRIDIGDSVGANWWCVMFPPLCFVDVTRGEIHPDDKESLRDLLSESEFALLDNSIRESDPIVRVRFRIVEWWQESRVDDDGLILVMSDTLED